MLALLFVHKLFELKYAKTKKKTGVVRQRFFDQ